MLLGFSCLVSEYREDSDRFFSWRHVATQITQSYGQEIFHSQGVQTLEQVAQRGCIISIAGDVENSSGYSNLI